MVFIGGSGEVVKLLKMEFGSVEELGVVRSFIMMLSIGRYEYGEKNDELKYVRSIYIFESIF